MQVYTIIRVYKVPAGSRQQAANRLREALTLQEERDFHVIDILREPGVKSGQGKRVAPKPPTGWLSLVKRQLAGRWRACLPTVHHHVCDEREQ
jgi:hypothetical protein